MRNDWMLLIYTLPSQPSRKRAYVWRELKKLGSLYLRDGVALLPRRPRLEQRLEAMVSRIEEYEGTVDLILSPLFAPSREDRIIERFQDERAAEYKEVHHACHRFLRDVLHEVDADDFGFPDVDKLESELGRLRRWYEQISERDYFGAPGATRVAEVMEKCERAFEHFSMTAHARTDTSSTTDREDAFERLSSFTSAEEPVEEDIPF